MNYNEIVKSMNKPGSELNYFGIYEEDQSRAVKELAKIAEEKHLKPASFRKGEKPYMCPMEWHFKNLIIWKEEDAFCYAEDEKGSLVLMTRSLAEMRKLLPALELLKEEAC